LNKSFKVTDTVAGCMEFHVIRWADHEPQLN